MLDQDLLAPMNSNASLDLDNAEAVRPDVLARFKSTRGLGRAVKRLSGGTHVVRTIDGVVYLIPVK